MVCGLRLTNDGWQGSMSQWQRVSELDELAKSYFEARDKAKQKFSFFGLWK